MDFLEKVEIEKKELDESYKQSKQNKADRHLESFSDDLRNSIIKKVRSKNMIRPYTPEEEEILRKGLREDKKTLHELAMEGFNEEQTLRRIEEKQELSMIEERNGF
jgi:hypothetical protein